MIATYIDRVLKLLYYDGIMSSLVIMIMYSVAVQIVLEWLIYNEM